MTQARTRGWRRALAIVFTISAALIGSSVTLAEAPARWTAVPGLPGLSVVHGAAAASGVPETLTLFVLGTVLLCGASILRKTI